MTIHMTSTALSLNRNSTVQHMTIHMTSTALSLNRNSTVQRHAHKLGHHHIQNYKKTTAVFGKKVFPSPFFSRKQCGVLLCSRELSDNRKQHFDELLFKW